MKDTPNIEYIENLARGNEDFKRKLIGVIQKELPVERNVYIKNFNAGDFEEASQNVHKLKHKISILGLNKGYSLAEELERSLKNNTPLNNSHTEFINLLQIMEDFVAAL
ncbi:Hpt domain-containing protein [Flavobacteriaceae bacterium R38]|nr:Hpt domain-containing protein [Flavobacteriaceae bacterium R38]